MHVWRRFGIVMVLALAGAGALWRTTDSRAPAAEAARTLVEALPARLSDQAFWALSRDLSEPNGYFRSENLVSNEQTLQYVIPALKRAVRPGGAYLGVAPDQNFTYIIAVEPRIAFVVDIRRGNLLEHLMYKALIELSSDRADFLSRLFSKKRPAGLGPSSTVNELFAAFDRTPTSEDLYRQNLRDVEDALLKQHGFPLSPDDLQQLEGIYFAFYWEGPGLRYTSAPAGAGRGLSRGFGGRGFFGFPTYEEMLTQTDWEGQGRSYLATESGFRFLKDFEERNLLVPVVGNFAGPKALRGVGSYLRAHGQIVTAFYVSNVEQYLFPDGLWEAFARNVATLPIDESSTFIRSVSSRFGYLGTYTWSDGRASALDPIRSFVRDFQAGRIRSYADVNQRSR